MKQHAGLVAAIAALALGVFWPAPAATDEELEVTMEVLDDLGDVEEIDADIPEMRGPRPEPAAAEEDGTATGGRADDEPSGFGDDFEHDDVNDEFDDDLADEGDFEDGEEVDDDSFDEERHDDPVQEPAP